MYSEGHRGLCQSRFRVFWGCLCTDDVVPLLVTFLNLVEVVMGVDFVALQ